MRLILLLSLLASGAFAESFAGFGITIQCSAQGVQVVTVLPGGPASQNGFQAGDQILSVDGKSLKGLPLETSTAMLRGQSGTVAALQLEHNGVTFDRQVTRADMQIQLVDAAELTRAYGPIPTGYTKDEVAEVMDQKVDSKTFTLLGVLQNGHMVEGDSRVVPQDVSSVYMGVGAAAPGPSADLASLIGLRAFDRHNVVLDLSRSGPANVEILDLNGKTITSWNIENAPAGNLSLPWNGDAETQGSYLVRATQGSSQLARQVQLH